MTTTRERRLPFVPLLVALLGGAALPTFVSLLRVWGRFIPQSDIEADYLRGLLWAGALGVSIFFWPVSSRDRRALLVLWGAKCFVTLGFMLLYEWNYALDAYGYFATSQSYVSPLGAMGWGNGTENLAGLVWLHARVLPGSYHALKVSFAMVGLLAVYLFYRAAVTFQGEENPRLLYVLGLYPSILFWSSILGKDPIQFLGIALYFYGVVGWARRRNWLYLVPLVAGVVVAMFIRFWFGPILLAPLLAFLLIGIRGVGRRMLFVGVGALAFWVVAGRMVEQMGLQTLSDLYAAADNVAGGWDGGSSLQRAVPFTSLASMLAFAPLGAFTALFRPLPGEVMNPFGLLAGLENVVLLVLLGFAILRTRPSAFQDPLVVWGVMLVMSWAGMYGFISYYNMGAAVRFKLQILPVLLLLLLYLARRRTVDLVAGSSFHGAAAPQPAPPSCADSVASGM